MNKVKEFHLTLQAGQILHIPFEGRQLTLTSTSLKGSAWLTANADAMDYILPAGGKLEIPAKEGILLQSLAGDLEIDVCICA